MKKKERVTHEHTWYWVTENHDHNGTEWCEDCGAIRQTDGCGDRIVLRAKIKASRGGGK